MCSCGWPIVVCRDPENDGWFGLSQKTTVCQVQAVVEREKRERAANEHFQPTPGEILNVVYTKEDAPASE